MSETVDQMLYTSSGEGITARRGWIKVVYPKEMSSRETVRLLRQMADDYEKMVKNEVGI